jgi:hypothetical protein
MKKRILSILTLFAVLLAAAEMFGQTITNNGIVYIPYVAPTPVPTNAPVPAIPALSGITGIIANALIDDIPYVSNGVVGVDLAGLYDSSNPHGTGKVGVFGDITFPTAKQLAVGIGGGEMAHHGFITPISFTIGTTLTNLPTVLGKWYVFTSDGPLYDFTGKEVGNWNATGAFHNWTINSKVNVGLKFGVYDDSVISGIGYFGALTGTF